MVGYYLGNLGELTVNPGVGFQIVDAGSGGTVYSGALTLRRDVGFEYTPTPYQNVYEANFTAFTTPGNYRLVVPGMGSSLPFRIHDGAPMALTRAYALGLYHQRCGTDNKFPFTRHTHGVCHTNLADVPVPQSSFPNTWTTIANESSDYTNNPDHTAMQLKSEATQLYPFVNQGQVAVGILPVEIELGPAIANVQPLSNVIARTLNEVLFSYIQRGLERGLDRRILATTVENTAFPSPDEGASCGLHALRWKGNHLL